MEVLSSKQTFDLEQTELRLGLPDHHRHRPHDDVVNGNGKRGFSETTHVDLKLKLNSSKETLMDPEEIKPAAADDDDLHHVPIKPPAKAQVVGWPPVRNFRKNVLTVQKSNNNSSTGETTDKGATIAGSGGVLIKVSMEGAPYLRKVDIKMYTSYQELSDALSKMFSLFTTGDSEAKGMINFMKEKKSMDLLNSSDFVPTYEDKDGDWMLIGDVPWEMFVESCKRLRIMKGAEAAGLAPSAMEKCRNRS